MSGLEVIGAISAVIGILDASIKIYESVKKDAKLNEAFQTVGRRLPVILDTLRACKDHLQPIQDTLSPAVCEALETMIEGCDGKAGKLRQIFEKTLPGDNEGWEKRYVKVFTRLGKGSKVEELMLAITEDVQLLVNHHAVQSAKPEQQVELKTIIRELKSVPSSVPKEEHSGYTFHSGSGMQTNNINSGLGQQINNNAAVGTQYFNSGKG